MPESIELVLEAVAHELCRAEKAHPPMRCRHEAYAVILEEVEEYWTLVRSKHPAKHAQREELIQIAAMCVRAIRNLGLDGSGEQDGCTS